MAALETVKDSFDLGKIINVPYIKVVELKGKNATDSQHRKSLIQYYLDNDYFASWEHLGGYLFARGEETALQAVKKKIKPKRGEHVT